MSHFLVADVTVSIGEMTWRVRPGRTEEIEDVWLSRSFAHELCNLLDLVRIVPSIYDANVRWWLRENSQCNIIDGETVFMAYLVEQFPSAALCLQDMWYNLISARLQLFRFAGAATLRVIILGALAFASISPSIIVGTLRFSSESRQVEMFIENNLEISDLGFDAFFVTILRVQFRSEIVQFEGKLNALFIVLEVEFSFFVINLQHLGNKY